MSKTIGACPIATSQFCVSHASVVKLVRWNLVDLEHLG